MCHGSGSCNLSVNQYFSASKIGPFPLRQHGGFTVVIHDQYRNGHSTCAFVSPNHSIERSAEQGLPQCHGRVTVVAKPQEQLSLVVEAAIRTKTQFSTQLPTSS